MIICHQHLLEQSPTRGIRCLSKSSWDIVVPGTGAGVKGNVAVKSAADRYYAQGDHITYAICRLSSIISNHCSPPRTEHTTTIFRLNLFCNLVKKHHYYLLFFCIYGSFQRVNVYVLVFVRIPNFMVNSSRHLQLWKAIFAFMEF